MNEVETKQCDKCEGIKYHNKGVGKTSGRPYENWKCNKCGDTEWLSDKPKNRNYGQKSPNIAPTLQEASILSAIRELRLLIQALAVLSGYTLRDLQDEFIKLKEKN